jgi:hypothetical protein
VLRESIELELLSVPADTFDPDPQATAVAAAYEVATQGVLAAGRQQRQQLRLRLISMVGGCVKAMAGQWQHLSWQWVADQCSLAAQLSYDIWKLEENVDRARTARVRSNSITIKQRWEEYSSQPMPQVLLQAMQHPYGNIWMHSMAPDQMTAAVCIYDELKAPKPTTPALVMGMFQGATDLQNLAGVMLALETQASSLDNSSSNSCLPPDGSSSSNHAAGTSSSSTLSSAELDIWLASKSVLARAVRLYGTVSDTALSNPCLFKSTAAEVRAAGAEQLARQLALHKAAGLLLPLPQRTQHQVDKNNRQYIGSQKGAAAVIGGLLGDVGKHLNLIECALDGFSSREEQVQSQVQLPQQEVQQLQQLTDNLYRVIDQGAQLWVDFGETSSGSSNYSDSDSEQVSNNDSKQDPEAVEKGAIRRWM